MNKRLTARAALQERIGYTFNDIDLLERALTHVSAVPGEKGRVESYQRFEFLGDRVLGLAVSGMLIAQYPQAAEGELSRRLAELVRAETCAEVAEDLDIGPAMRLGEGEAHSGGRRKKAILADICEAVIGAVFLDGGFEAAEGVVQRLWHARMLAPKRPLRDGKTALQEWAQAKGLPTPVYREISRSGPDHNPVFGVVAVVEGLTPSEGQGASKRVAEQKAAEGFLLREGIWSEGEGS